MDKKYQFNKEQEERFQLQTIREDGLALEFIDNPSKQLQLEAVRQNGLSIEFIDNPSEQMQLEAVRQYGNAIKYINNPSLQLQLEAIRQNGFSIRFIKNPSSYIKSIVDVIETSNQPIYVLHEPNKEPLFSIGCQKNITKDYFIWRIYNMDGGLEKNPYRREYLDIINKYVNKYERFIMDKKYQFSKEQEERFQIETVRQDGFAIQYIDNPSEEVQIEAAKRDGYIIQYLDNPSEQVQLAAIRQNGSAIDCIKNPSDYIKSIVDIIRTFRRDIYVLHESNKEPLFTIGCQHNITKGYFIWRIYNLDGGLEENPHRQEYLDILNRY